MGISIADFESVHIYSTSQELISIFWLRIHLHYQRNSENGSEEERILGWSFTYSLFSSCSIGLARDAYTSILIVDVFKIIHLWLVFSDYSTSNSLFHFRHPQSKVYSWYLTLINRIRIAEFYSLFESFQTILLCSRCIHRSIVLDSCSNGSWTRVWRMLLQMIL